MSESNQIEERAFNYIDELKRKDVSMTIPEIMIDFAQQETDQLQSELSSLKQQVKELREASNHPLKYLNILMNKDEELNGNEAIRLIGSANFYRELIEEFTSAILEDGKEEG